MTQQLTRDQILVPERGPAPRSWPRLVPAPDSAPTDKVVLYGDFTCPWSYLASRRAAVLAADGLAVDWRAVQSSAWVPTREDRPEDRVVALRQGLEEVAGALLPGEELPDVLAGFIPETEAAVSAYAEAYVAGSAPEARHALFSAFWLHGVDLADARLLRTLLLDAVRWDSSPSDLVRDWGYVVDNTGGPVSASAWRTVRSWAADREATGTTVLPILLVDEAPLFGAEAVAWLGAELLRRGLHENPNPAAPTLPAQPPDHEVVPLSWASEHGNRWMRDFQRDFRAR